MRLRLFAQPSSDILAAEIDRLCRPESDRHVAVLVVEGATLVGVAACERTEGADDRGERSVLVADVHCGRGIGTLLLEDLAARAHAHGITELTGEVSSDNARMLRVARDLSAVFRSDPQYGIVEICLATDGDEATRQGIDVRERAAERAFLRRLLAPE